MYCYGSQKANWFVFCHILFPWVWHEMRCARALLQRNVTKWMGCALLSRGLSAQKCCKSLAICWRTKCTHTHLRLTFWLLQPHVWRSHSPHNAFGTILLLIILPVMQAHGSAQYGLLPHLPWELVFSCLFLPLMVRCRSCSDAVLLIVFRAQPAMSCIIITAREPTLWLTEKLRKMHAAHGVALRAL